MNTITKAKRQPAFSVGQVVRHIRTGETGPVLWASKGDVTRAEQMIRIDASYCASVRHAVDFEVAS